MATKSALNTPEAQRIIVLTLREGQVAYRRGISNEACPYGTGADELPDHEDLDPAQFGWLAGWYGELLRDLRQGSYQ